MKSNQIYFIILTIVFFTSCNESKSYEKNIKEPEIEGVEKKLEDNNPNQNTNKYHNRNIKEVQHNNLVYKVVRSDKTHKRWLDRNIGATEVCSHNLSDFENTNDYINASKDCFGDYFQWGRLIDGHEKEISLADSTQALVLDMNNPKFITSILTNSFDWALLIDKKGESRKTNWLKSDGLGVCPEGFKVPTIDELKKEDEKNFLKLPNATYRNYNGKFRKSEQNGYYWSSSISMLDSGHYGSEFIKINENGIVEPTSWAGFANAMSIRCVEDLTQKIF